MGWRAKSEDVEQALAKAAGKPKASNKRPADALGSDAAAAAAAAGKMPDDQIRIRLLSLWLGSEWHRIGSFRRVIGWPWGGLVCLLLHVCPSSSRQHTRNWSKKTVKP